MQEQQYAWMLGALIAWRAQQEQSDNDPGPVRMKAVTGVAGSLHHHQTQAANELAAGLCLFLVIFVLVSVKYRAIFIKSGPILCKIPAHVFLPLFWLAALKFKGPRDLSRPGKAVPNKAPPHNPQARILPPQSQASYER